MTAKSTLYTNKLDNYQSGLGTILADEIEVASHLKVSKQMRCKEYRSATDFDALTLKGYGLVFDTEAPSLSGVGGIIQDVTGFDPLSQPKILFKQCPQADEGIEIGATDRHFVTKGWVNTNFGEGSTTKNAIKDLQERVTSQHTHQGPFA